MTLLAKSPERGGLTLREHTEHVVAAAVRMARSHGLDERLARCGAVLHDLGKAHPFFQSVLRGEITPDDRMRKAPHRHELSSILLLPLFDETDWPALIEMVVGHHKSVRGDRSERGLMDLLHVHYHSADHLFERHTEGWATGIRKPAARPPPLRVTEAEVVRLALPRGRSAPAMPIGRSPEKGWPE